MKLKDKRVLVIGGGSGIGLGIAKGAAEEGARVTIASRNAEKIAAKAKGIGGTAAILDVSEEANVEKFFKEHTGFDHIAFTAGDTDGLSMGALTDLDLKQAASRFNTRFWGAVAVAKHGAIKLPPGGSYTFTNGMLAHRPMKGIPIVSASAMAAEGLALGLAVDLSPVRVNCVCPGLIETELFARYGEARHDMLKAMARRQLIQRPGTPEEAAEAYLTCMRNTFMTGQILKIEGGIAIAN
ncbi:MAG TPA: SDR family oxidoreductase [Rhizomicrobium sp.]|jgi:NAD(P)-dependent dehydrogenase (short-subunit alcohol dehydrogenase family)